MTAPAPAPAASPAAPGRVIAVVGPSGVGKDSVMAGLVAAEPSLRIARRVITRPPHDSTEAFTSATPDAFDAAVRAGAFCLHWGAHDLRYGIPAQVAEEARAGQSFLLNLSRGVLAQAATVFDDLTILRLSAAPDILAKRLAARGRETETAVTARLARSGAEVPPGLRCVEITNDGALSDTVAAAHAALRPVLA